MAQLTLVLGEGRWLSFHTKGDLIEVTHIISSGEEVKTEKLATLGFLEKNDCIHLRDFLASNIANPPPVGNEFLKGFSRALLPIVVEFAEMMRKSLQEESESISGKAEAEEGD